MLACSAYHCKRTLHVQSTTLTHLLRAHASGPTRSTAEKIGDTVRGVSGVLRVCVAAHAGSFSASHTHTPNQFICKPCGDVSCILFPPPPPL